MSLFFHQCWRGTHRHVHCLGRHDGPNRCRGGGRHLWICRSHPSTEKCYGANRGNVGLSFFWWQLSWHVSVTKRDIFLNRHSTYLSMTLWWSSWRAVTPNFPSVNYQRSYACWTLLIPTVETHFWSPSLRYVKQCERGGMLARWTFTVWMYAVTCKGHGFVAGLFIRFYSRIKW